MDTLGSLSFAIVVATLVHTYFIQPFTIPTSSLEKSLLVGDFLFVSKFHYGARTPMTPIAAPMVHDTLPFVKIKSYTATPQLPYFRFPALQKIERNDIVVFNWPADTLFHMYKAADKRYDKPIDKKTNYVKRCTAIPGDKIEIKDGVVYINGKESVLPERAKPQYSYKAAWDGKTQVNLDYIKEELHITDAFGQIANDTLLFSALPLESVERIKNIPGITKVERIIHKGTDTSIFPGTKNWNVDNLGPIYIPQAGKTVELNAETLPFYKKVIGEYEGKDLKVTGNEIRIDGKVATSYTFEQDYYWMMGDNRHNSLDSRYWGFVPADHIVGKPIFIWMSIDGINDGLKNWSIRWDRLFTTVSGTGQPQSYFKYFLFALAGYFAFDYFRNKKKKKED
jgi:signal peptidase I